MSDWYVLTEDGKTPVPVPDITTDPEGYTAAMHNSRERYDWIVSKDEVGAYSVSTVFLFLDHRMTSTDGDPILWESMVFGEGPWADYQDRYTSRDEAERGHKAIIAKIEASAETDAKIREMERQARELRDTMLGYDN